MHARVGNLKWGNKIKSGRGESRKAAPAPPLAAMVLLFKAQAHPNAVSIIRTAHSTTVNIEQVGEQRNLNTGGTTGEHVDDL